MKPLIEENAGLLAATSQDSGVARRALRNTGFVCALVATVLLLCSAVRASVRLGTFVMPAAPLVLLATMLLLMFAARLNDVLIKPQGLIGLKIAIGIGGVGSLLLLNNETGFFGAVLCALFIAASILLWGSSLASYERTELLLTTAVSFITAGIILMLCLCLETGAALVSATAVAVLSVLAALGSLALPALGHSRIELAVSRSRGTAGWGNDFTLISIGMQVGAALIMGYALPLDTIMLALTIGGTVTLSALATVFFRARFKQHYEDLARRTIAVFTTCSVLPYPFVPAEFQLVCVCLLVVSATINCIILIDAVAETARLKRVSPYWLIGNEGAFFILGTLLALVIFWLSVLGGTPTTSLVGCIILAVVFAALQTVIEGQSYPYFEMLPEEDAVEFLEQSRQRETTLHTGGAKWRERMEEVADAYKLSPRQQEVMRLLLKGRDVRFIMSTFVISQATAKTHVYNLYKKLGVHSRRELLDLIEQAPVTHQDTPQ